MPNAGDWIQRINAVLHLCRNGDSLEQGAKRLPHRSARTERKWKSLREAWPRLSILFDRMRWVTSVSRHPMEDEFLSWLERCSPSLLAISEASFLNERESLGIESIGLPNTDTLVLHLVCCWQQFSDPSELRRIVEGLTSLALHDLHPSSPFYEALRIEHGLYRLFRWKPRGPAKDALQLSSKGPTVGRVFVSETTRLTTLEPSDRTGCLKLMANLATSERVAHAQTVQRRVASEANRLWQMAMAFQKSPKSSRRWNKADSTQDDSKSVLTAQTEISDRLELSATVGVLQRAKSLPPRTLGSIATLFSALSEHGANRPCGKIKSLMKVLQHQKEHAEARPFPETRFRQLVHGLSQIIQRHQSALPMEKLLGDSCWPLMTVLYDFPRQKISHFVLFLESILNESPMGLRSCVWHSIPAVFNTFPCWRSATEFAIALNRSSTDKRLGSDELKIIRKLGGDVSCSIELLKIASARGLDLFELEELILLVGSHWGRRIVHRIIAQWPEKRIHRLAHCVAALNAVSEDDPLRPKPPSDCSWLDRYPQVFRESLTELNEVSDHAEKLADNVLGKHFPDRNQIRCEIQALEQQLAVAPKSLRSTVYQQKRLASLCNRLNQSPLLTKARCENLNRKLLQQVNSECEALLFKRCQERIQQTHQLAVDEEWLSSKSNRLLFHGVCSLKGSLQTLGFELLNRAQNRQAVHGMEVHQNAAFINGLESRGIDTTAWFDPGFRRTVSPQDHEEYQLAFTREPLDYLLMGHHFDTCLAPDSFNFYSTISNAVDINKQVLYGKTASGRVVGRCLMALSADGRLTTYQPYAHDAEADFSSAVRCFLLDLASRMNVRISSSARIPNLLSTSWYDDGPLDYLADLKEALWDAKSQRSGLDWSLIQLKLEELSVFATPDELVQVVLNELPNKSSQATVKEVLNWACQQPLRERTRFRIHLIGLERNLPMQVVTEGIKWKDQLRCFTKSVCRKPWCTRFHGIADADEMVLFFQNQRPDRTLQILRSTRQQSIRSDLQETSPARLEILEDAHRRLGRVRLSAELQERRKTGLWSTA